MKTANIAIFIGALAGCLIADLGSVHAQSPAASITLEGDNAPWNRGVPIAGREAARDLFLEGNRLFKIPLFTKAAKKYVAAIEKWKHPAFYFNLALAQLNLGQEVEAHENLKQAIQHGEEPLGVDQFHEAQKQLAELEHQLGRLRVSCPTAGAEVMLDGAPAFTGPGSYEAWVKPTTHEVSATRPDYLPKASRVTVRPGERKSLDVQLVALIDAEQTRWARWKPWAVVATGAAVGLTSGGLHAISRQGFKTYDDGFLRSGCATPQTDVPTASSGCTDKQLGAPLSGRLRHAVLEQEIAVGGYIAAGALITAGAVLVYLNRPRLVEQDTADPPSLRVAIVPVVSVDMLGVAMTVSR